MNDIILLNSFVATSKKKNMMEEEYNPSLHLHFRMKYPKNDFEVIGNKKFLNNFKRSTASIVTVNTSLEDSVSWGILTTSDSQKVPFLRVESFSTIQTAKVFIDEWRNSFKFVVEQFVANFTAANSSKVVVDVISNGGGNFIFSSNSKILKLKTKKKGFVCLSRWLSARLVPSWYPNPIKATLNNEFQIPLNIRSESNLSKSLIQFNSFGINLIDSNPYTGNLIFPNASCYANNPLFYSSRPNGASTPLTGK